MRRSARDVKILRGSAGMSALGRGVNVFGIVAGERYPVQG